MFEAVAEARPRRILEVGGGPGELAERMRDELRATVEFVDISPRMVELARARGLRARLGDVQELPFAGGGFDCAVAAWMLFHVPDLERGLAELARVLRPGGKLVAATNGRAHLKELHELAGDRRRQVIFSRENGERHLRRYFGEVERRDADGWVTIDDRETVERWLASIIRLEAPRELGCLEPLLRARTASSVFVATR